MKMLKNKLITSLISLLALSSIFLAFTLRSSDPFAIVKPKSGLHQGSTIHGEEKLCDLSVGKWVREPKGSLYTNSTCRTLPDSKNCARYGKAQDFVRWRWEPDGCELPRFDPVGFLGIVRGKTMAFAGDSLARNQMESLLCLLSQAETPTDVYKDAGDKFRTWHFPSHNFTLMAMWANFLVEATERVVNGAAVSNAFDIHLDRPSPAWANRLPELHYMVISAGNWFFRPNYLYENGSLIGCVGCDDGNLTRFTMDYAFRRVFRTSLRFIRECEECDRGLVAFLRTFSPAHFEHGSWFTGGYCNRTRPLDEREAAAAGLVGDAWGLGKIQMEELGRVREGDQRARFQALDVTKAMVVRADGHPGSNLNGRWMRNANDCLHWCLPGPVDMWNDVLLATLKKIPS